MTLPASGQISMSDVNTELLLTSTATISLNDPAVRTLAGVSSGAISLDNLHGKSNRVAIYITIASNAANYEVKSNVGSTYIAGKSDVYVTVNSGVWVYGSANSVYGMYIRNFTAGDTVTLINNGLIVGAGGNGGGSAANNAGVGGPALYVNGVPTSITNNYVIYGGGGGGGEGQGVYGQTGTSGRFGSTPVYGYIGSGGGAGGVGFVGGAGGVPYTGGNYIGGYGGAGSTSGPGSVGIGVNPGYGAYSGNGGAAGSWGAAGATGGGGVGSSGWYGPYAGGAAGYYLVGSNYVTWLATGYLAGNVTTS